MYDSMLVDATHLANVTFHAAKAEKKILQPMEMNTLKQLEKKFPKGTLTALELEELTRLRDCKLEGTIGFACHLMLTALLSITKKFPSKEIVMAWDEHSWRKKYYHDYKGNRKKLRDERTPDEVILYDAFYELMVDYHKMFGMTNVISLKVTACEADDICGSLASKLGRKKIMVVSGDSDYKQLLQLPSVDLYDPRTKKKVNLRPEEARWSLFEKVVRGDKSDNVPSAWPRVREPVMREMFENPLELAAAFESSAKRLKDNNEKVLKTIKKLADNKADLPQDEVLKKIARARMKVQRVGFKEAYQRNEVLISFDKIPGTIHKAIWKAYENQKYMESKVYSIGEWTNFVREYKLQEILKRLSDIKERFY